MNIVIFTIISLITIIISPISLYGMQNCSHDIRRPDGSLCRYYLDTSNMTQDQFSIIALLQGSETRSASQFLSFISLAQLKELNAALLIIEKQGITSEGLDLPTYLQSNSLLRRAQDYDLVIEHLRSTVSSWNRKLLVCGVSEGATLAAFIGPRIPETIGIIMFSGGCGMTLREEILLLENKKSAQGITEIYKKYTMINYIKLMLLLSKLFPESAYTCIGETNTLKYWNSIGNYNPASSLSQLSIPLYLAHGTADTNCPFESALALVAHFNRLEKTNLQFHQYEGYDHNFNDQAQTNHWDEVIEAALHWAKPLI